MTCGCKGTRTPDPFLVREEQDSGRTRPNGSKHLVRVGLGGIGRDHAGPLWITLLLHNLLHTEGGIVRVHILG